MNWRTLFLGALVAVAANVQAEDKVKADDLEGEAEVSGINFAGKITGDTVSDYALHDLSGKVSVATKGGQVHRVEVYTEWSAENDVRGQTREILYVSGGSYTGWTERFIQAPGNIIFSRTVINGDIQQEIAPDGSGFIEWTVAGGDNTASTADSSDDTSDDTSSATDSSSTDSSDPLPTVDIDEEGEFNGVSDRRIDIDTHDNDHPTVKFSDDGYETVKVLNLVSGSHEETVNQKLTLKGHGKGSLSYTPEKDDSSSSATPTPTPSAIPTPTPTPSTTFDTGSDTSASTDDSSFF